jgi:6-phosphogluconolactonase
LACFKVNPADGTLSSISNVPTEKQPRGFQIDSSGRYLLTVGELSNALSSYAIDPESGKLTKRQHSEFFLRNGLQRRDLSLPAVNHR